MLLSTKIVILLTELNKMPTQDIFIIEPNTSEEADALKAFAKALKLKFQISKKGKNEILEDLHDAVKELNLVKKGETKARDAKELLNEL